MALGFLPSRRRISEQQQVVLAREGARRAAGLRAVLEAGSTATATGNSTHSHGHGHGRWGRLRHTRAGARWDC